MKRGLGLLVAAPLLLVPMGLLVALVNSAGNDAATIANLIWLLAIVGAICVFLWGLTLIAWSLLKE
ncbi:hypothetical protein EFK50_07875 [Nocardioides marmoriginsengisoli]|uniref:Uncharacterized protein n=1 Tax=Nocardioides marmoriginsengisoli TaxID=661483 RepID=A0A3N0CJP1_9ACTN|nr:hypothetical protein EFK50_07875 [Nocardioides marmoriginsengisoli]